MPKPKKHRRGNPKTAVAYLRASTDDQALSPDTQRTTIEAWASTEGVQVASWHADLGVSGSAELEKSKN